MSESERGTDRAGRTAARAARRGGTGEVSPRGRIGGTRPPAGTLPDLAGLPRDH